METICYNNIFPIHRYKLICKYCVKNFSCTQYSFIACLNLKNGKLTFALFCLLLFQFICFQHFEAQLKLKIYDLLVAHGRNFLSQDCHISSIASLCVCESIHHIQNQHFFYPVTTLKLLLTF